MPQGEKKPSFFLRAAAWLKCFSACSSTVRQEATHQAIAKAVKLIDSRIAEVRGKETNVEERLVRIQRELRALSVNIDTDPYPDVLMHRIKAHVVEKQIVERNLVRTGALLRQLQTQRATVEESSTSSDVLHTLHRVLKRVRALPIENAEVRSC